MTVKITYQGALRCSCEHLQSGSIIETDAPTDNFGKGERFSPTDSVCMALATCIITTMGIHGRRMDVELAGSTLEVTKHMISDPRRIGRIEVILHLKTAAPIDENTKIKMQDMGDHCPVMLSLHPEIIKEVTYLWN